MSSVKVRPASLLLSSTLAALAGCGDDTNDNQNANAGDAQYVIMSRIFGDDGSNVTSYLHLVPSLEEGTEVKLEDAVEVPGAAKLYALDGGWLAVGSGDGATITRYEVDPERGLQETEQSVDLQPSGVSGLWDTLYVASPTKVYYVDRDNAQLVIVNPEEMSVEGEVALPDTVREGYLPLYSYSAITRGDKLIFSVGWFDWTNDQILPETGLVVFDTAKDEVERFDVDDRCGGVTTPVTLGSGDTYYVSSALNASTYFLGREAAKPCALRVLADEDGFDPDYALDLGELTGGALAGEPLQAGDGSIILRVLNEDDVTTMDGDFSWDITGQLAWQWWKWEPGADGQGEAVQLEELEPSKTDVVFFQADGHTYASQTNDDDSETVLIDLTAEDGPKTMLTVPGFASGLAKLQ